MVGSVVAQPYASAQAVDRDVILIKKNKKARKRLGWRKRMRRSVAHAHHHHVIPRTSGREIVVVVPIEPEMLFSLEPPPAFSLGDPYSRRALQAPPQQFSYGPPVQPDGHEPEIATVRKGPSSAEGLECDEAIAIVQDFGFSGVESRRCSGAIYEFSAVRDGQEYAISLRAEDGELTRVERQ